MSNPVHDRTDTSVDSDGPVVLINIFTPKNGDLQTFVDAQIGEYKRQRGLAAGWIGNTLCRTIDGTKAVNLAVFESREKYLEWRNSDHFADHLDVIRPLIEKSEPHIVQAVYGDSALSPGKGIIISE